MKMKKNCNSLFYIKYLYVLYGNLSLLEFCKDEYEAGITQNNCTTEYRGNWGRNGQIVILPIAIFLVLLGIFLRF